MGKQGPCCHCGITTTPLWRNGPPQKPVLCNACGSRWKTKGTLLNYMPLHSGGFGADTEASADLKWARGRKKGCHKLAEQRSHKRKELCQVVQDGEQFRAGQSSWPTVHETVAASRSRTGSGSCSSEVLVQHNFSSTSDLPVIGTPWDALIPSKKRSATSRLRTPIDKLSRFLKSLLVDHAPVSCAVPDSSSEALLVEYNKPSLVALEIGLGSVFVRHPIPIAPASESETSCLVMESDGNDPINILGHRESAIGSSNFQALNGSDQPLSGKGEVKQVQRKSMAGRHYDEENLIPNKALLEIFPYNQHDVLQGSQSPLVFMEMKDIVNFDTFSNLLTEQEQSQLMQYMSSVDVARKPESLKCMFNSAQFEGALCNFQHLLSEGMFDSSELSLISPQVLQHYQQLLTVTDLSGSEWAERCAQLQNRRKLRASVDYLKVTQNKELNKETLIEPNFLRAVSACSGLHEAKYLSSTCYDKIDEDIKAMKTNCLTNTISSASPAVLPNASPVQHGSTIKAQIGNSSNEAVEIEVGPLIKGTSFLSNTPFLSAAETAPTIGEEFLGMESLESAEAESILFDATTPMSFQQADQSFMTKSMEEEEFDSIQLETGCLIMSNTWHTDTPTEWSHIWNSSCGGPAQVLPNGAVLNPGHMLT